MPSCFNSHWKKLHNEHCQFLNRQRCSLASADNLFRVMRGQSWPLMCRLTLTHEKRNIFILAVNGDLNIFTTDFKHILSSCWSKSLTAQILVIPDVIIPHRTKGKLSNSSVSSQESAAVYSLNVSRDQQHTVTAKNSRCVYWNTRVCFTYIGLVLPLWLIHSQVCWPPRNCKRQQRHHQR